MIVLQFDPFPGLITERTTLRPLDKNDEAEILALRSSEAVNKYLTRKPSRTVEEARNFIEKIQAAIGKNVSLYWAISLKNEEALIGTVCLWNFSLENHRAEIGFEILPAFQGQGLMAEAVRAVLDLAFEKIKLHSVEGFVDPRNTASIRLLEKNHFKKEAHFRENSFFDGKFLDTAVYGLLASEWG
jgi:ribosomal-protein-alanine N-acetyltransferase